MTVRLSGRLPARDLTRAAAVTIALALGLAGCGGSEGAAGGQSGSNWLRTVHRDGQVRQVPPFIALNCPVGNAFRCDRLVFQFAIRAPARQLSAWVAGRPVRELRTAPFGGKGPRHGVSGLVWTGHVQPAGLTEPGGPIEIPSTPSTRRDYWAGTPPVRARIRVVAELRSGETVTEVFPTVSLGAGYG